MGGLALFGDLTSNLQKASPVLIANRLKSVKLLPDAGVNPQLFPGMNTRLAINTVEQVATRRCTCTMTTTIGEDAPHDGAPTSWSTEADRLATAVHTKSVVSGKYTRFGYTPNRHHNAFHGGDYYGKELTP